MSETRYKLLQLHLIETFHGGYRRHSNEFKTRLTAHIKRYGLLQPLVVREIEGESARYQVIDGDARLHSLRLLSEDRCVCVNVGPISEDEAIQLAIMLNEGRGHLDHLLLAERVQGLLAKHMILDLLATLPYDETELKELGTLLTYDWKKVKDQWSMAGVDPAQESLAFE